MSQLQPEITHEASRVETPGAANEGPVPREAGSDTGKQQEDDQAESRSKKKQRRTEPLNVKLLKLAQAQWDEIKLMQERMGNLKERVEVLQQHSFSGTSLREDAYSIAEFAMGHASSILRRLVAEDHLKLSYNTHKEEFRSLFHTKYVEAIEYSRVATEVPPGLLEYLSRTEVILANQLGNGVKPEEVETFLRLYSAGARLDRSIPAISIYYFSIYKSQTRKKSEFPSSVEWRRRLMDARRTAFCTFSLEELKRRLSVMKQLNERLENLSCFTGHSHVFRAFLRLLLSIFPELVAKSLDAANAEQGSRFGCVILEHLKYAQGSDWRLPGCFLLVEKSGCLFRYRNSKRSVDEQPGTSHGNHIQRYEQESFYQSGELEIDEDEQWVWEQKIGETWVLNGDAWTLLLGVHLRGSFSEPKARTS